MSIFADIRYALRLVRHDWRFSLILIATLATGIAASGAIFNVVNASLLRPLPIPDEARVYRLQDYTMNPRRPARAAHEPGAELPRDQRRGKRSFLCRDRHAPRRVVARSTVTHRCRWPWLWCRQARSTMLGARVQLGRLFTDPTKNKPASTANVVVLSHSLWQRQFGGRRTINRVEPFASTIASPRWSACCRPDSGSPTTPRRGCPSG